ncbi:APC family permease [Microvirga sp. M2]|uniref:APC family permease n=1 Tax=Microvirga sp. M2 TaxID=3073270 RepID=UPI0039C3A8EC
MTPSKPLSDKATNPSHKGSLGIAGLTVHLMGSVLGAGILILPGAALHMAGPASIAAWAGLIAFSYAFAWTLVRLSVENQDCHGLALFARRAFGMPWERSVGLLLALAVITMPPTYAIAAAQYLAALDLVPPHWPPQLIGIGVVLLGVGLNLVGLRLGTRVQIILVSSIAAMLLTAVAAALPAANPAHLVPFAPNGWAAVGTAMALCFFSVLGWENAAPLYREVWDPERTLPRAVLLAVTLVGALYLALTATIALTVHWTDEASLASPVSIMLATTIGTFGRRGGDLVALVLLFVCANAWHLTLTRLLHAFSCNRMLPVWCSRVSASSGAPVRICLLAAAAYVVFLVGSWGFDVFAPTVMGLTSAMFLVVYAVTLLAAWRLLKPPSERAIAVLSLTAVVLMMVCYSAVVAPVALGFLTSLVTFAWTGRRHTSEHRPSLRST